jgi:hypothetical protein
MQLVLTAEKHPGDEVILNKTIEEWPKCDILISFFSEGKAKAYLVFICKVRALISQTVTNSVSFGESNQRRDKLHYSLPPGHLVPCPFVTLAMPIANRRAVP